MNTLTLILLIVIPRYGFDPTEAAVPWKYFKAAGYSVVFATPDGQPGQADIRMLTGQDLGVFKNILMSDSNGIQAYHELENSSEFQNPISYDEIRSKNFGALFLPGGHDKGMREYLESKTLQKTVAGFFQDDKPVAAICHGTLLAGRSTSSLTGKSVLWERKTTGLTQPQELTAFNLTRLYLGDYYRTYPETTLEEELKSYLIDPENFLRGPGFPLPLKRDSLGNEEDGFVVLDRNYLSARWPGDAHRLGKEFTMLLSLQKGATSKGIHYDQELP